MGDQASLERLLAPRSVAVVGAEGPCSAVLDQNTGLGFPGPMWPVHPSRRSIGGHPAYPTVADLPGVPDAAFVAVPAAGAVEVVRELAALGCGGVVCYASGFAESPEDPDEGGRLQRALLEAAAGMPLLGPNCYGHVNYVDGVLLWPDQHGGRRLEPGERGVAVVAQSSSIAISVTMQDTGLPVAHVVTVGNGAQLSPAAVARALVARPAVSAIGLIVESLSDVRGLELLAAEAREHRVPVAALVLGRSATGRRLALTHSASLADDSETASEFLRRNGIGEARSVPSLLATLSLLHCGGPLDGTRLASLSCSGGEAALAADAADGRVAGFVQLSETQRAGLRAALGQRVALDNPLDYHTYVWGDRAAMTGVFAAMASGPVDLTLLFADLPRADRCDARDWETAVAAFGDALRDSGARGALTAALPDTLRGEPAARFVQAGLPVLAPPGVALDAVEAAATVGQAWAGPPAAPVLGPGGASEAEEVGEVEVLDEAAAKALLRGLGVSVPDGRVCRSLAEVAEVAVALREPFVVKALGLAHKSDADAVRVGVPLTEVSGIAEELLRHTGSVLVEELVTGAVAEVFVGVERDRTVGPVLTVGSGGVLVEVLADARRLLLPTDAAVVRAALLALRGAPVLRGVRGRPAADLDALVDVVLRIGELAAADRGIVSLDVNPVLATPDGAWCVDALVVRECGARGEPEQGGCG